jgi:hypothetical protein
MTLEDLLDRRVGAMLDLGVEIDERHMKLARHCPSDRCLSASG